MSIPVFQSANPPIDQWRRLLALTAGAVIFCLVAILNCGGYRYGISDQAFYVPAVVQHLNPAMFPRDREILHVQDRFMLYDEATAVIARATGIPIRVLFFAGYVTTLIVLFGAIVAIGRPLYRSWWTVILAAALLTLRHRITQTGANTLEAYFQPRLLAFALGAWAIAAYLRGKGAAAVVLIAIAFTLHPTTAMWFGVWVVVALAVTEQRWRTPLLVFGGIAAATAIWAVSVGPLRGHLIVMDALWASALEGKDYIFPSDWSASFWLVNLSYLGVAISIYLWRRVRGIAIPREIGMLAGALALLCVFLISWPLMNARIALALQLQTSRIFWMLDLLATVYLAWLLSEAPRRAVLQRGIVAVFVAIAIARGVYVWRVEHPGDPLIRINFPQDQWTDAMTWISRTAADAHVLADPGHAWKYGTSVRVSGERDVYVEEVKDLALALYSRDVAVEALRRIRDSQNFSTLTTDQLRSLAARYDLDYLVVDRDLNLPVAYHNDRFSVYLLQSK